MKFRVIFLKKSNIYYAAALTALILLISILLFPKRTVNTFSVMVDNTTRKQDLTGDGKEDILYIKTNKDKYFIQVNTLNESLNLEPNKALKTVGTFYPFSPMRLFIKDVSRDKIPEIFIQAMEKDKPVQHVFVYNNGAFEDIFCAQNNILGFIDSENSKTPKVISGNFTSKKIDLENYIFLKNKAENFSASPLEGFMGKDTVFSFITYIQGLPYNESYAPQNIYSSSIGNKDLSIIGKLAGENNTYRFQNAMFKDIKWDKTGDASQVTWSLSFKATSNTDSSIVKNCTIDVKLKANGNVQDKNYFKIFSITLE